jgi:hypothetical protein
MGPRAGVDDVKKNSRPYRDSNSDPSVVQPVASFYTDYAIPAPKDTPLFLYFYKILPEYNILF